MMGERQSTDDVVQEAFLKVWRAADSYLMERASVRTWRIGEGCYHAACGRIRRIVTGEI
jgi:hypothetical protein